MSATLSIVPPKSLCQATICLYSHDSASVYWSPLSYTWEGSQSHNHIEIFFECKHGRLDSSSLLTLIRKIDRKLTLLDSTLEKDNIIEVGYDVIVRLIDTFYLKIAISLTLVYEKSV